MKKTRITAVLDIIHGDNIRVDEKLNGLVMPDGKIIRFTLEPEIESDHGNAGKLRWDIVPWHELEESENGFLAYDGYTVRRVEQLCDVPDDYFDHPRALGDSR